ncbi:TetR/AcrR family transcriptional regulator [Sphaerisporangium sp. NPDC005288]|uniref:TetR/AcrR family transcriptional regulator n=1 Tax=Sphaerisporangium rhizosphaerae TaxID=2269375 RepID=A0ABW2PL03_9ACTN
MEERLGLRERKKRETRQRIADIAMGLFMMRGFDNVTVAEVARVADVSVNTVFNYFRTKEDLFLDRQDAFVEQPSRIVRERRPGESVIEALRRDYLQALDEGDWRSGLNEGAEVVTRMIDQSPSLLARMRELSERREERLAETLAEVTGAAEDDVMPVLAAAQICAVTRRLAADGVRRKAAGEGHEQVVAGVRAQALLAFDLLEKGLGRYGAG